MKSLILESDPSLPLIHISLAAPNGASQDPDGKEGLCRLTLRLMRRTAGGKPAEQVDAELDRLGGALGVDVGCSSAGFSGSLLRRSLSPYLELLRDALQAPGLSTDELARLKRDTIAELVELRDNDSALARTWFRRRLFGAHKYGRSTMGTRASIESFQLEDVRAMADAFARQGRPLFAFAGDVSAEEAQTAVAALGTFGGEPQPLFQPDAPAPLQGRHLVVVDKPERTQTQIAIGSLGTWPHDEDHIALLVSNTVFGGTFTSRLTQEVRANRGWSYGAYSSLPYDRARQAFSMWTFPAASDAAACVALQVELLRTWIDTGITEAELENAKQFLIRSSVFNTDTAAKRMSLQLDEALYGLPPNYYATYSERVAAVTLEQANAAVRNRLSADNLLTVVVGTAADIRADVEAALGPLASTEIVPFDTEA